jgi:hypothetical protein
MKCLRGVAGIGLSFLAVFIIKNGKMRLWLHEKGVPGLGSYFAVAVFTKKAWPIDADRQAQTINTVS